MGAQALLKAAAIVFVSAGIIVPQNTSAAVAEIEAMETKRTDALRSGDPGALQALLSDELVYTHSNGHAETRSEFLRNFKTDIQKIEYTEQKIQVFGDAAVLTARALISGGTRTQTYQNPVRVTHVWKKGGGTWQIVVFQSTFIR